MFYKETKKCEVLGKHAEIVAITLKKRLMTNWYDNKNGLRGSILKNKINSL